MQKKIDSTPTLILGWADLRSHEGGGYNVYTRSVLSSMRKEEAYFLRSTGKRPIVPAFQKPRIVEDGDYLRIKCFRIDHNPIVSPTAQYYSNEYFSTNTLTPALLDFINKWNIQKIIIQSHEGFPLNLISEVKKRMPQIELSVFVHDAFYLCPKVHMFKFYKEPCFDNNLGRDCKKCAQGDGYFKTRLAQIARNFLILKRIYKSLFKRSSHQKNLWQGNDYNLKILKNISQAPQEETLLNHHRSLIHRGLINADQIICFSEFYKTLLESTYQDLNNVSVQRIHLPHFEEISQWALTEKKTSLDRVTLCFHGSSNESKGLDLLLKALSMNKLWIEKKIYLKLLLNEPIPELHSFEKQHRDRITIQYNFDTKNLASALSEADISVFTSRLTENSPLTVLEALHAGHFIVAPNSGGTPEFLNSNYSELFSANDSEGLSNAVAKVYQKFNAAKDRKKLVIASLKKKSEIKESMKL